MGNTDSIPVVSQTKSVVQLVCGDVDGAAKTQENFLKECPGVSQVTSAVQLVAGDTEGALETQKRCGKAMLNMVDGVPVVGHVKGVVHYAVGDKEGGDKAMKSATRTTGVIAGGAGGFLVGGPAGAIVGGMYGGATVDTATTVVTGQPSGYIAQIENVVQNPTAGNVFDTVFMPVADGFAGYGAGNVVNNIQNAAATRANLAQANVLEAQAAAALESAEAGSAAGTLTSMEYLNQANQAKNLFNQAQQLKGNTVTTSLKGAPSSGSAGSSAAAQATKTSTATIGATAGGDKNTNSSTADGSSSGGNGGDGQKGSGDKKKPSCDGEEPREGDVSTSTDRETATLTKNLPSGSRLQNVTNQGPVSQVATRTVNGSTVVDYVRANIQPKHLGTGLGVTDKYRKIIQALGLEGDEAGHIIAKALGGLLDDNLFPQNPTLNNGFFKGLENLIIKFLKKYQNGTVDYQVRLVYNPGQTRPYGLFVLIRFYVPDGRGGWRLATDQELQQIDPYYNNPLFQWIWNPHPDINYPDVH